MNWIRRHKLCFISRLLYRGTLLSTVQELRDEIAVLSGLVQAAVTADKTKIDALTAENAALTAQLATVINPADLDPVLADVKAVEAIVPPQ